MRIQYREKTNLLKSNYTLLLKLNLDKWANTFKVKYNAMNYDPHFIQNFQECVLVC